MHTAFLLEDRYAMALGGMDQYLYPFYENDIRNGIITKEEATELLKNVFIKIDSNDVVNICIGGTDKNGRCRINELSYCILDAVKSCNIPGPNLSAKITADTPDEFLDECFKVIGTGLGYPAIMNDDVNIAALKKYGYEAADIYNYSRDQAFVHRRNVHPLSEQEYRPLFRSQHRHKLNQLRILRN